MTPELIEHHLTEIKETLSKILEQSTKTNGRVTSLELWRERMIGTYNGGKITMALIGGSSGLVGAIVGALLK